MSHPRALSARKRCSPELGGGGDVADIALFRRVTMEFYCTVYDTGGREAVGKEA